mgnify:CR=1 FL=1
MNKLERAQVCAKRMYENDKASRALGIEIEIPEPGSAVATMTCLLYTSDAADDLYTV